MSIKQTRLGGHIITYNDETSEILSYEPTKEYKVLEARKTTEILAKKEEFKARGMIVVKKELIDDWGEFVENSLKKLSNIWYNGAILEAALQCMEKLSQGASIEEAYTLIDVQDPDLDRIFQCMEISGWQNRAITSVVASFHELGQEFCQYRNDFVNGRLDTGHPRSR